MSKLPPVQHKDIIIANEQNVNDIKKAILREYELDKNDYDLICKYFLRKSEYKTLENIYLFLKRYVRNVTESEQTQTLRTPAVLLSTGLTLGADCKNYALFVAGIIGAINRAGVFNIPFCFRFAKYLDNGEISHHVFVVALIDDQEIWIDAIDEVPYFNFKKQPYSYSDKNVNDMLIKMSGYKVGDVVNDAVNAGSDAATGDWLKFATDAYTFVQSLFFGKRDYQVWQEALSKVSPDIAALTYLVYTATLPVFTGGNGDSQIARYSQFNELFGRLGGNDKTSQLSSNVVSAWNGQVKAAQSQGMPVDGNNLIDPTKASNNVSPYVINGVITKEGLVLISKTGLVSPAVVQKLYNDAPTTTTTTATNAQGQPVATAQNSNGLLVGAGALLLAKLAHIF